MLSGFYPARVVRIGDGNVTVLIPQIYGDTEVVISEVIGYFPDRATDTWVAFLAGDPDHPVLVGVPAEEPERSAGFVTARAYWNYSTQTGAPPNTGQIRWNETDTLFIHKTDADGFVRDLSSAVDEDRVITIRAASGGLYDFVASGPAVDNDTYWSIPISEVVGNSAPNNNTRVEVSVLIPTDGVFVGYLPLTGGKLSGPLDIDGQLTVDADIVTEGGNLTLQGDLNNSYLVFAQFPNGSYAYIMGQEGNDFVIKEQDLDGPVLTEFLRHVAGGILYLNQGGGAVSVGEVSDTIQLMPGRIIQAWSTLTAVDLTLQNYGGYVFMGKPTDEFQFEFRPDTGIIKFGPNAPLHPQTNVDEMRLGVYNTADTSIDYVRVLADETNTIKLIGAPTNFLIANLLSGNYEGIDLDGTNNVVGIYVNGVKEFDLRSASVYIPPVWDQPVAATTNPLRMPNATGLMQVGGQSSIANKTEIEDIEGAMDRLMALRPVWFRSTLPGDMGRSYYSLIAEEAVLVDPRFGAYEDDVTFGEDGQPIYPDSPEPTGGPIGLADRDLMIHAIAVCQEQQQTIEAQQATIDDLLARVTALEQQQGGGSEVKPKPLPGEL